MCRHTRKNKIRNEKIQDKIGVAYVMDKIRKIRLRWSECVKRRCIDTLVRSVRDGIYYHPFDSTITCYWSYLGHCIISWLLLFLYSCFISSVLFFLFIIRYTRAKDPPKIIFLPPKVGVLLHTLFLFKLHLWNLVVYDVVVIVVWYIKIN